MRTILSFLFGALLLVLVFIGALPTLISTDTGNRILLDFVNARSGGQITAQRIKLSWLGSQELENFTFTNANKIEVVQAEFFRTDTSLLSLLLKNADIGATKLSGFKIQIPEGEEKNEKDRTKEFFAKREHKKYYSKISGPLELENGRIDFLSSQLPVISILDINGKIDGKAETVQLAAKTVQGATNGSIAINGSYAEKPKILMEVIRFPTRILDDYLEIKGRQKFYGAALGETLDLYLEFENEKFQFVAYSKNLSADWKGKIENDTLILNPNNTLTWSMTPQFFTAIIPEEQKKVWRLAGPTSLVVKIDELALPLDRAFDWNNVKVKGDLQLARAELLHDTLGHFALVDFSGKLASDEELYCMFSGKVVGNETATISGKVARLKDNTISISAKADTLPLYLLDLFSDGISKLHYLVGSSVNAELEANYGKEQGLSAKAKINSAQSDFTIGIGGKALNDLNVSLLGNCYLQVLGQRYLEKSWR